MMSERDSFPDEVPVADAAEQDRPVSEPVEATEPAGTTATGAAPLETDPADWRDQSLVVEVDDEDFR